MWFGMTYGIAFVLIIFLGCTNYIRSMVREPNGRGHGAGDCVRGKGRWMSFLKMTRNTGSFLRGSFQRVPGWKSFLKFWTLTVMFVGLGGDRLIFQKLLMCDVQTASPGWWCNDFP
jgi:hypothetical protein